MKRIIFGTENLSPTKYPTITTIIRSLFHTQHSYLRAHFCKRKNTPLFCFYYTQKLLYYSIHDPSTAKSCTWRTQSSFLSRISLSSPKITFDVGVRIDKQLLVLGHCPICLACSNCRSSSEATTEDIFDSVVFCLPRSKGFVGHILESSIELHRDISD